MSDDCVVESHHDAVTTGVERRWTDVHKCSEYTSLSLSYSWWLGVAPDSTMAVSDTS
jgi:hypothetical protein